MTRSIPASWLKPHWRIFCFHGIADSEISRFRELLLGLSECGFTWLPFNDAFCRMRANSLSGPTASVTFDDGELSIFTNARRVLNDLTISAMLYVVPDYVDKGSCFWTHGSPAAMDWHQVREWISCGHEVGTHTLTHAPATHCDPLRLRQELEWSTDRLLESCRMEVRHFAYPYGLGSTTTRRAIKELGRLHTAAGLERGRMTRDQDPFWLKRDLVFPAEMSLDNLLAAMRTGDRWQWAKRLLRWLKPKTGAWRTQGWEPLNSKNR